MLKYFIYISIFLFAFLILGAPVLFYFQLKQIKEEAKASIVSSPDIKYDYFLFSEAEFSKIEWKEKNKEFVFKKLLYDVVSIKKTNQGLEIKCLSDFREMEFFNHLKNYLSKSTQKNIPFEKLVNLISIQYLFSDATFDFSQNIFHIQVFVMRLFKPLIYYLDVPHLPPKIV